MLPNEQAIERQDDEGEKLLAQLQDEVRELGLWAPHVPPEAGGSGTGFLDYAYLNEHIGRSMFGQLVFGCQAPDAGNAEILHLFAHDPLGNLVVAVDIKLVYALLGERGEHFLNSLLNNRILCDVVDMIVDHRRVVVDRDLNIAMFKLLNMVDLASLPPAQVLPERQPERRGSEGSTAENGD